MGFRFDGKLQQIHHVEDAEIYDMRVEQPAGLPDLRHDTWWAGDEHANADHVLYTLGPAIIPPREVRTGKLFQAARVEAALDLQLTATIVREAGELTRARYG